MADLMEAARDRVGSILDPGSFVEIGALVTGKNVSGTGSRTADGDGVITGYGTVSDRLIFVCAQNPAVKGGSIGEMHAKKISNIYSMAVKMGAPVLFLADCAGLRVDEGNDSLYSFGKVFQHAAKASGVIPLITAIYGNCGGGMAVLSSLSDFCFMEKDAKLFVQSPDAVTGNFTGKCDTASAAFRAKECGDCDFIGSGEEIAAKIRELISFLPQNNEEDFSETACTDDLNRSVSGIENLGDKASMLREISDDGKIFELKKEYAECVVTAFIRLNGKTIGAVANNKDEICANGLSKAASFLRFCDAFNIPVLTLCDVKAFRKELENEKRIAKSASLLTFAYSDLTVPSVTVVKKAYGTAGLLMGGKALGTDLVFALVNAEMGIMEKEQMNSLTDLNKEKDVYSAQYNAEKGLIDDIIDPAELRQRLAAAFEMLYSKCVTATPKKHSAL